MKGSFAWGLDKDINALTGETEHLIWNPYADVYGYGYAYFEAKGSNAMLEFSVYVTPLNLHLIDIDFQLTNGYCVDISTFSQSLHFELNANFGWRTCGFSVFEWFTTDAKGTIENCPMSYYGTDYDGNSLPIWEFDLLDYLNQKMDWFSYCLGSSAAVTADVPATVDGPVNGLCV